MIKCFFKRFNLLLALHDKVLEDGKGLDDGEQGQGMQEQGGKVQGRVLGGRRVQVLGGMVQVRDGDGRVRDGEHGDQCG